MQSREHSQERGCAKGTKSTAKSLGCVLAPIRHPEPAAAGEGSLFDLSPSAEVAQRRDESGCATEEHWRDRLCHDNCADTGCATLATLTIGRCAKMTIRERALRFAHTDAASPPDSSRHSRRGFYVSGRSLVGHDSASEPRASHVHAAKILDRRSGKTSR